MPKKRHKNITVTKLFFSLIVNGFLEKKRFFTHAFWRRPVFFMGKSQVVGFFRSVHLQQRMDKMG